MDTLRQKVIIGILETPRPTHSPKPPNDAGAILRTYGTDSDSEGSSSYNKLLYTIIPLLIITIPLFIAFLLLRRWQHRIYAPRTFLNTLHDEEKTPKPAYGMFNWISTFRNLSDQFVLKHQSLDNYLFIRYFRMLTLICLVGTAITWPVLLPVHYRGAGKKTQLDRFTFSNVISPKQYYWHVICAWLFFGFVMYIITKETIYYTNLRQAYLTTPRNATRVSTRVVLFTDVPKTMRHESWIKADFLGVKRVWWATDCTELEKLVDTMNHTAISLEYAEIKLSMIATKKLLKGKRRVDNSAPNDVASQQWISSSERPSRRIAWIGRKVDAIQYYRDQLKNLISQVKALQKRHIQGYETPVPAVFVEFETQRAAQIAYSSKFWNQPGHMQAATIGLTSTKDVIWANLARSRPGRWQRTIIANIAIAVLIVFWSFPIGLAGQVSNLDELSKTVPALQGWNKLPSSVRGTVSGLLPTIIISALVALVPILCRFAARFSGCPTLSQVELQTQAWYFIFQVVQVFLIASISNTPAYMILKEIRKDPGSAPGLLANHLPEASTFYLSYFLLQGLAVAASTVFQVAPFLLFNVVAPFMDSTPRRKYERWITLASFGWGNTYPKFTLFAVIAISYSCVAPFVLGFALIGTFLLYLAFRYNVFYVLTMSVDTKGEAYGRALQHLSVGVYIAELCLIGLMAARGSRGPATMMTILLVCTAAYHFYLNSVLKPLTNVLSDELMAENEEEALVQASEEGASTPIATDQTTHGVQPKRIGPTFDNKTANMIAQHFKRGGLFAPFLFNGSKSNYPALRRQLWNDFPGRPAPSISEEVLKHAYHHPSISAKPPTLWIVRDELGVSKQEIEETKEVVDISDDCARFNEKGKIEWDRDDVRKAPIWKDRVEL